jgi:hypothetical protein
MVRCRMCGAEINLRARACQRCGAPGPGGGARPSGALLIIVGACLAGGCFFATRLFYRQAPDPAPLESTASCEADWTKCADNAALMKVASISEDIKTKCREAGDRQSKYGTPAWPWNAFATARGGRDYIDSGIAVAIENSAQVETRAGAVVTSSVVCRYDLVTKTVLSVEFSRDLEGPQVAHRRKAARLHRAPQTATTE